MVDIVEAYPDRFAGYIALLPINSTNARHGGLRVAYGDYCGLDFSGEDGVPFASDSPFDPERGAGYIRATIKVLESIEMCPRCGKDFLSQRGGIFRTETRLISAASAEI